MAAKNPEDPFAVLREGGDMDEVRQRVLGAAPEDGDDDGGSDLDEMIAGDVPIPATKLAWVPSGVNAVEEVPDAD